MLSSICLSITIIHNTLDFSYFKNYISQIIQLIGIIFFIGFLSLKETHSNIKEYIERLTVSVFFIQSLIQVTAFLSPSFAKIIHLFYLEYDVVRLYEHSGKIRGLALSSSTGWGLAVGYACSFLFYTKIYLIDKKINSLSIILGLVLVIGSLFSGRTALVGLAFSFIYYLISNKNLTSKLKEIFILLVSITFIIISTAILFSDLTTSIFQKVFPFAFEPIYNYISTGKIETVSTNQLMSMWDRDIPLEVYFYGTGLFTDPQTGDYYMNTDAGYLRNLFYGGLPWIICIFIYHKIISGLALKHLIDKNTKTLLYILFLMSIFLELKAMTIGFNKYLFTILTVYQFSIIAFNIRNKNVRTI
jgi:hypothetical protein